MKANTRRNKDWNPAYDSERHPTISWQNLEQYYPKSKGQIWLTKNLRILFHALLIGSIVLGFFAFPYDAPVWGLIGCVLAVVTLGWLAKKIPNTRPASENLKLHWRILLPQGFSVPAVFLFMFTSAIIPSAIVTMIAGAVLVLVYERLLSRCSLKGWNDFQRLGLAAGALFFFALFLDPVLKFLGKWGSSVVGIGFAVFLFALRKRLALGSNLTFPSPSLGSELPRPTPTL